MSIHDSLQLELLERYGVVPQGAKLVEWWDPARGWVSEFVYDLLGDDPNQIQFHGLGFDDQGGA